MDLFGGSAPEASGDVPREIYPGIVWDEATESRYRSEIRSWVERFPNVANEEKARAMAEQSARWHLELHLIWQTVDREVAKAKRLYDPIAKRKLHTEWLRTFGSLITDAIVRAVKDPQFRSPDLGRRL